MIEMTAEWLNKRLEDAPHGTKARLAEAAGLNSKQMSYILGGTRRIQQAEAAAFAAFFGENVILSAQDNPPLPGFSEPVSPYEPPSRATELNLQAIVSAFAPAATHISLMFMNQPEPALQLMQGDILFVDIGRTSVANGDSVVCQVADTSTATARMMLALAAGSSAVPLPGSQPVARSETLTIMGKIVGSLRLGA